MLHRLIFVLALVASPLLADSPEDAVERLNAAAKAGDLDALIEGYAEPMASFIREIVELGRKSSSARDSLQAALDEKFGKAEANRVALPLDLEGLRARFMQEDPLRVEKKEADAGRFRLTIKSVMRKPDGSVLGDTTTIWLAVQDAGRWRLMAEEAPKGFDHARADMAPMKDVPDAIAVVERDVRRGTLKTRDEALNAVKEALDRVLNGSSAAVTSRAYSAISALKTIVETEVVWRLTDSDQNGVQDYWTLDVAGFYYLKDAAGEGLQFIAAPLARADSKGLHAYTNEEAKPRDGYWVKPITRDAKGEPYNQDVGGDGLKQTNRAEYGFCAYPARYGESGRITFIVNEEGMVYGKDLGPDAREGVEQWPGADPTTDGWREGDEVVGPAEVSPAADETWADSALMQLVTAEGIWRQTDSDQNGVQDYWTLDVAGFYYLQDAGGTKLRYIDIGVARADAAGLAVYSKDEPRPSHGYWVKALAKDAAGRAYSQDAGGSGVKRTNATEFGFCAFPSKYGSTGKFTFLVNEEGVVYRKDLGPQAPDGLDQWPGGDPKREGWESCR